MQDQPSSTIEEHLGLDKPEYMANLKLLYQLNASLGSSFDMDQVLEVVMDLVFEHVKADRGIILLVDPRGELVPQVVRTRDLKVLSSAREPSLARGFSRLASASWTESALALR